MGCVPFQRSQRLSEKWQGRFRRLRVNEPRIYMPYRPFIRYPFSRTFRGKVPAKPFSTVSGTGHRSTSEDCLGKRIAFGGELAQVGQRQLADLR